MATATQTQPTAKATKGFGKVLCPFCGDAESTVTLDLNDLKAIECGSCGETFSPREAVAKLGEQMRRWQAIAAWTEAAGQFLADA